VSERPPLNVWRVVVVLALLPVLLGMDRWAYWLSRSVMWLHLRGLGATPSDTASLMTGQALANTVLVVLGGAVALGTGPVAPLVVGLVLSAAGYGILAASSSVSLVWVGVGVLALGQGLAKPAFFALAAAELGHPREQLRALAFVLLYAVLNASALTSGTTAGFLSGRLGAGAFAASAGVTALAVFLALGLAVAWLVTRRPEAAAAEPLRTGRVLMGAAGLIALAAPYVALLTAVSSVAFDATSPSAHAWITVVNPLLVILTSLFVMLVLVVLHLRDVSLPALFVVAAGMCLAALSTAPVMIARTSVVGAAASEGLLGIAEVLVGPFAMARVVGDVPRRFQALVMSGWFVVSGGVPLAVSFVTKALPGSQIVVLALLSVMVFVVGIALLALAKPASRWLYEPR